MTEDYTQSPEYQTGRPKTDEMRDRDLRTRAIRATYLISLLMLIVGLVDSITQYSTFGAWQILADGAFILLALVVLLISLRLYSRNKIENAFALLPWIIWLAYAPGELFLEGVTAYNIITGILLFGLAYLIFRPISLNRWVIPAAFFLGFELLFSLVEVFPKFDIYTSPSWPVTNTIISAVLTVLFVWQILATLRLRTIQSKMLASLIGLALVPAIIIGAITAFLGFQRSRDQIGENLIITGQLKAFEINALLTQATNDLSSFQQEFSFLNNASLLPYFTQQDYRHAEVLAEMEGVIEATGNFNDLFILGPEGTVLISTDETQIGTDLSDSDLFTEGWQDVFITPAAINPETNQLTIQIAQPLILYNDEVFSILVGDLYIPKMFEILTDTENLGDTGETYLLSENSTLLTPLRYSSDLLPGRDNLPLRTSELFGDVFDVGSLQYTSYQGQPVVAAHTWIPELNSALILEQAQTEAFASINFAITLDVIISIVTLVVASSFAIIFTRSIAAPIKDLSDTAHLVSSQELDSMQPIDRDDEIGELSHSLSNMTSQMLQTSQNLERIVAERTAVLERRATYLEATAEIGRAITNIRDLDDLLSTVSHLISEKFGFYHVGIFIIDPSREYAELKAANSEGGWRMLAREHKLKVGEQGIVGYVTGTGSPRIQQQVAGEDSVYYDNPDLPLTRSEMALPITSGGEILGCLDVQSTEEQAFSDEDVNVLQVLADEVAVAITNTNLFLQLEERLETERRIFGQITQEAWSRLLKQQSRYGYRADYTGIQTITETKLPESQKALLVGSTVIGNPNQETQTYPLSVPVKVRGGHTIAVVETQKPISSGPWTREEISILEGVGEQLGVALENARLFEETQKSAQRERLAADLSGKIWASTDIDTILQTAVRELGSALSASEGSISLSLTEELTGTDNSNDGTGEA